MPPLVREKLFACPSSNCAGTFTTIHSMLRHQYSHLAIKPFQCPYCKARFIQNQYLKEHIHLHTGKKPYSCDMCKQKFRQAGKLSLHRKIHNTNVFYIEKIKKTS